CVWCWSGCCSWCRSGVATRPPACHGSIWSCSPLPSRSSPRRSCGQSRSAGACSTCRRRERSTRWRRRCWGAPPSLHVSLKLRGVPVGATRVVAIGILDDLTDLPASLKLAGHIGAAAAAIAYGVMLNVTPTWVSGFVWINVLLTILWFVTVTNAVQFLDGMDGLAAGLGVIVGVFFSIAAL